MDDIEGLARHIAALVGIVKGITQLHRDMNGARGRQLRLRVAHDLPQRYAVDVLSRHKVAAVRHATDFMHGSDARVLKPCRRALLVQKHTHDIRPLRHMRV